ncbi:PLDc_N domain-containing protein [Pseudomonas aeruginosa]|uniref:PLD nuclease N-terminal domain-containing protein n=1 Tax=Pseudomonas aeruginosa TaxID=287 RepID=UPI00157FAF3F|nr:PLD nuclease N-terminal domain-containing protein [Pseudomonas aeruginosa]EKF8205480.1 PLDc_N domain-containing protein [Pseudomonas aeruginosa]EKI0126128.1 PLDc_N domain-containing protein [Pseudomonas aeruginosa]MBG6616000.1 PLDc_N domain-containing protein [Pseudomonas aeruginosa]MBG6636222.1 PLDc_N domain-containing protein [Pseudomonas aeruginosa]MBI7706621.1 PLDc_N domain-containing protein [Pseudomonas aeruginosa]
MSQSLAFLLIGLATLVGFYDLWALVSVFRSDRSVNSKALWSLLIAVLPVLSVLIWAVAGPRAATARPRD